MEKTSPKPCEATPVNPNTTRPSTGPGSGGWQESCWPGYGHAGKGPSSSNVKHKHPKKEGEATKGSAMREGVDEVIECLVDGATTLRNRLFGHLVPDTTALLHEPAVEETNDLVIYVEKTLFKLGKSTATNTVLDRCVDILIQTMRFTNKELEQVQRDHRMEIANLKAEQKKLQNANTTLTELLQEYREKIEEFEAERDCTTEQIKELNDELEDSKQEKITLRKENNQWRQKFAAVDAKRLAAKLECERLVQENDRLNQKLIEEKNRQRFEEMKRKMEEFERQEAEVAHKKREEEEKRRQEEEERKRKAREKAEQERRAREAATAAEEERCRNRDDTHWGEGPWTSNTALDRFHVVTEEFTTTKYSMNIPITIRSIPWPVLSSPSQFTLEDLNWKIVEDFLRHTKEFYAGEGSAKYARILKQLQLMFHPDRWSSRNLLLTMIDSELREKLRQAGKVVSQAVNQWVHEESRRSAREA